MSNCLKLPLSFDPERLKADLNQILPGDWVSHFNDRYYEGDWSGVALRAVGGIATQLYSDPTAREAFADTSPGRADVGRSGLWRQSKTCATRSPAKSA